MPAWFLADREWHKGIENDPRACSLCQVMRLLKCPDNHQTATPERKSMLSRHPWGTSNKDMAQGLQPNCVHQQRLTAPGAHRAAWYQGCSMSRLSTSIHMMHMTGIHMIHITSDHMIHMTSIYMIHTPACCMLLTAIASSNSSTLAQGHFHMFCYSLDLSLGRCACR